VIFKKNKIIFSDFVKTKNLSFNYIDIGARGDISSPWLELENCALIVGFEPDTHEAKRLNDRFKDRKYFDMALWSEKTTKIVYINKWESTSSMYKPNSNFISNFEPQHWEGRIVKSQASVQCETLDDILFDNSIVPNFIKIDTQGAELDILRGAKQLLCDYAPLVTCETWCAEVYKDAPLMHEIIAYMDSLGYQVFDMEIAAAWRHGASSNKSNSKTKSIGYEVLFVKTKNIESLYKDHEYFLKFILLLELYGYRDYAIYLLSNEEDAIFNDVKNKLIENQQKEMQFLSKIFNKIINAINKLIKFKYRIYPNLKY